MRKLMVLVAMLAMALMAASPAAASSFAFAGDTDDGFGNNGFGNNGFDADGFDDDGVGGSQQQQFGSVVQINTGDANAAATDGSVAIASSGQDFSLDQGQFGTFSSGSDDDSDDDGVFDEFDNDGLVDDFEF